MPEDKNFTHYDLDLVAPDFDSPLTDLIVSLNNLRDKQLIGSTHPQVFLVSRPAFPIV